MQFFPFFIICSFYIGKLTIAEDTKLLFVQILFRHGDRAPIKLYPNDPIPASVWPEGLGKLTLLGRKQHYALGKYFRDMYKGFATFSPLEIEVISSEVDRCLRSAETNMASFYAPNSDDWVIDKNLKWQPIPVKYIPEKTDRYLETGSYCPRAVAEQVRLVNSPEGQKFLEEHKEMLQNLTHLSGSPLTNWTQASYFHDTLFIEKKYNHSIPPWVEPFWDELEYVADMSFFLSFNSPLLHRLRAGPLLQRILQNIEKKISGDIPDVKFVIYSGHDTNIAVILDALNLYNFKAPPYCSSLLFELHEIANGTKAVRLLFQNSSNVEQKIDTPQVLILKGCSEFCPLQQFIDSTASFMPEDWETECQLEKTLVQKIKEKQVTIGWFFVVVAVLIVSMTLYAVWRMYGRRQDKDVVSAIKYNSLS